jgi:hypothetical protein
MNGIDGIQDSHRATWTRLTRLNTAVIGLPVHTTRVDDPETQHTEHA